MFKRVGVWAAMAAVLLCTVFATAQEAAAPAPDQAKGIKVGTYPQQVSQKYAAAQGLPSNDVLSIAVFASGVVAGTKNGAAVFSNGKWNTIPESEGTEVPVVAAAGNAFVAIANGTIYRVDGGDISEVASVPEDAGRVNAIVAVEDVLLLATENGVYMYGDGGFSPAQSLNDLLGAEKSVRQIAIGPDQSGAVAAKAGLFERTSDGSIVALTPREGARSWAPYDVRGVAYDTKGRLWFASPQGVGVREGDKWTLYTGQEGLPYNDFTGMAADPDGSVWFGTKIGAIHFDGTNWEYREGLRWLPGDEVRGVAVGPQGGAWFATNGGAGLIEAVPMTLAEKAKRFEDAIDKYHRRTPFGYVLEVNLPAPGDTSSVQQHDSDNDGLWTSMYGAGECFAYGATKNPYYKERAQKAFKALKQLMDATQGGTPPSQPGFVARTILPTSGPNPNAEEYTPEKDKANQQRDKLWKVMDPRWGTSADGQWYWKSDTSSDELDGHYFFYGTYYDLACDTEAEKEEVRQVVRALTDHLVRNDFQLIDHDGKPTRWAVYNPERFNHDLWWCMERGLNSLSILSYLVTANHVTGDAKYLDAFNQLVGKEGYHMNLMYPKYQNGPGSGNQSDDEMAFMSFYNLLKYTDRSSDVHQGAAFSWWGYWQLERPEMNPLFDFMFAGQSTGADFNTAFSDIPVTPRGHWLEKSIDQLKRFPLDRVNWRLTNNHRLDIVRLPNYTRDPDQVDDTRPVRKGHRVNGYVLPIDEQFVNHWNHDPWELNQGGNGQELADGASYLLPYYMGLYHGFVIE